ncbi:MAG: molybdopterin-binding protein [bacterium]|nr:molybdopterin-binding protein [bacterium]
MAQRKVVSSDEFTIGGTIKSELMITVAALESLPSLPIQDQILRNHKGEIKDTLKNVKGVPLNVILGKIEFVYKKPRELDELYFVMVGSEDHKVVFSYNEIFNSDLGNRCYFITEINGKKLTQLPERILFISTGDENVGHRYIQGLKKILIKRVD